MTHTAIHTIDMTCERKNIFYVRRKIGGGGLMIWGSFDQHGKGYLKFIDGKMNMPQYRGVLRQHLVNIEQKIEGCWCLFQHDKAPIHQTKGNHIWFI